MRSHRAVLIAFLIGIAPVIAGCTDGFDMDKLDVLGLNQKKKLPGERHALFPEGVPGVQQGIPPEYMKGNVAQQPGAAVPIDPLKPEQVQPAQTAEEKPKPKKRVAAKPKPTRVNVSQKPAPQPAAPAAASPWPSSSPQQPANPPPQQASSPWPDPQQQQAPAPWPSAPPPGTFSKQ